MISCDEYERCVKDYADMALRIAVNYCKNITDAEDIVQDVFLKLYTTQKEFRDEEHKKRWLIRVTINSCKNHLNSAWKRRMEMTESVDLAQLLNGQMTMQADESEVFMAVRSLPEKYRGVVHLYYFEDYSVKEIASILRKKETTVKARLMRARIILKEKLKGMWENE